MTSHLNRPIQITTMPTVETTDVESTYVDDLYSYIQDRGFFFSRELITRYLLSMRTKPFVIFNGISGTGKSKLALLCAEYYAVNHDGTRAARMEQPIDDEAAFFVPIDAMTLRSGTLPVAREQNDYFRMDQELGATITVNITNILGAQGDITFRLNQFVTNGQRTTAITVPISVRRCFEETGVQVGDYLRFEVVEEFKRFRVSLFRPEKEYVEIPSDNRYAFVSVRPSWHDHTSLLGYYDPQYEEYRRTPVLELLLRASREERDASLAGRAPAPYFIILDEMNLARIEHYFADFLSALESRRSNVDGTIAQEPLHLHEADASQLSWTDENGVTYAIPTDLPIPTNVLFTGTVNDDETTHGLSPKVLDRANTLEFSTVDFDAFLGLAEEDRHSSPLELTPAQTLGLELGKLELGNQKESTRLRDLLQPLLDLNGLLLPTDRHFGYRVINEIAQFLRNTHEVIGTGDEVVRAAVDSQILQKALPVFFHPTREDIPILTEMLFLCAQGSPSETQLDTHMVMDSIEIDQAGYAIYADGGERVHFPRSSAKLFRLMTRLV